MRIHFLGICGTFMAGLAVIAKQLGHDVSGSDEHTYPPMSDILATAEITVLNGYEQADFFSGDYDQVVIGNVLSRGNPAVEHVLESKLPYFSGPEWLHDQVLKDRHVLAVAGTHGKTTTASMLAWILECAGYEPSFLIGGACPHFDFSARLTQSQYFVIEADEYDTAFFDKRPKFLHYRPNTLILNNVEFDHADIYRDLTDVQRQFHYLLRSVPPNGKVIFNADDVNLPQVLEQGIWSSCERFGLHSGQWQADMLTPAGQSFEVRLMDELQGTVNWSLIGDFNVSNALAAIAAAAHVGIKSEIAIEALAKFKSVKRRAERIAIRAGVTVYEDFAHHPTAIGATLRAFSQRDPDRRLVAMLQLGSRTQQRHVDVASLAAALNESAEVVLLNSDEIQWDLTELEQLLQDTKFTLYDSVDEIVAQWPAQSELHDQVVIMSNKSFDNLPQRLLQALEEREQVMECDDE
jgi:UDP-N-acetylmuramate: L-alanyl-gamma-D-glutamyl-meso-diaminopimelate ligase